MTLKRCTSKRENELWATNGIHGAKCEKEHTIMTAEADPRPSDNSVAPYSSEVPATMKVSFDALLSNTT
jgi:hypothetical protein